MVPPAVSFLPAVLAGLAVRAGHAGKIRECSICVHCPNCGNTLTPTQGPEGCSVVGMPERYGSRRGVVVFLVENSVWIRDRHGRVGGLILFFTAALPVAPILLGSRAYGF